MSKKEAGIKSVILIPIIIAKENDKQNVINLLIFLSLIFKKIISAPILVDKPAISDINNGITNFIMNHPSLNYSTIFVIYYH